MAALAALLCPLALSSCEPALDATVWFPPIDEQGMAEPVRLRASLNAKGTSRVALLVHGLTGSSTELLDVGSAAGANGWRTLRLDLRGHGRSGGNFPFENPDSFGVAANDVRGALAWLRDSLHVPLDSIVMVGISLGGGAVIANALEHPEIRFVAWYPGLTYLSDGDSLVNRSEPRMDGVIIQGTGAGIERSNARWTRRFAAANPSLRVLWLDGPSHGTGGRRDEYLSRTGQLLAEWRN